MSTPEQRAIETILEPLTWFGLHPDQSYGVLLRRYYVPNSVLRILVLALIVNLVIDNAGSVDKLLIALNGFFCFCEVPIKTIGFVFFKLRKLHENLQRFWPSDVTNYLQYYVFYKRLTYVMFAVYYSFCIAMRMPLMESYIPKIENGIVVVLALQLVTGSMDPILYVVLDSYFCMSCFILKAQFDLLLLRLDEINRLNSFDEIRELLRIWRNHHDLLLRYIKTLSHIYSVTFMLQYLINVGFICVDLYTLHTMNEARKTIVPFLEVVALLVQLSVLCIPAAIVSETASRVHIAVYSLNWYEWPVDVQKDICFIIQSSQKPATFSGMGMVLIDFSLLTVIFEKAYSFYTFVANFVE